MSEPAAGGKIRETDIGRYRSTRGLDYESVPWKLWEKSDPADLDFSPDAVDWQEMNEEERTLVALPAAEQAQAGGARRGPHDERHRGGRERR
jgi:hypothetical protein